MGDRGTGRVSRATLLCPFAERRRCVLGDGVPSKTLVYYICAKDPRDMVDGISSTCDMADGTCHICPHSVVAVNPSKEAQGCLIVAAEEVS